MACELTILRFISLRHQYRCNLCLRHHASLALLFLGRTWTSALVLPSNVPQSKTWGAHHVASEDGLVVGLVRPSLDVFLQVEVVACVYAVFDLSRADSPIRMRNHNALRSSETSDMCDLHRAGYEMSASVSIIPVVLKTPRHKTVNRKEIFFTRR